MDKNTYYLTGYAGVVQLDDTIVSNTIAFGHVGSNPTTGTEKSGFIPDFLLSKTSLHIIQLRDESQLEALHMWTYEEYREILTLWEAGTNKKAIARMTGIPRRTVIDCIVRYGSLQGLEDNRERANLSTPDEVLNRIQNSENDQVQQSYAYLLGLYLGDGYISRGRTHRVYRLRVALDQRYTAIIQRCVQAIETLLPENKTSIVKGIGCVNVTCYNKFWPEIFPQTGIGPKHTREIKLEAWQQEIVDSYPLEFFRGLYHSDGSRYVNRVNNTDYPRYEFSNVSDDIRRIFCKTCDLLGFQWTATTRKTTDSIYVSKRKDVAYLDSVIGPKS